MRLSPQRWKERSCVLSAAYLGVQGLEKKALNLKLETRTPPCDKMSTETADKISL